MKRHIKASEVKPGMEIEWKKDGWTRSGVIAVAREAGFSQPLMYLQNIEYVWEYVGLDQEVTVLKEARPDEPTAFGACVKAAGVKYVRNAPKNGGEWENAWFSGYRLDDRWANTWEQICERGPVTVINADPFANTEPREPRKWDRWEDVPDGVTVSLTGIETPYRKVGGRIECKPEKAWGLAFADEHLLNKYPPFTEVLGAL